MVTVLEVVVGKVKLNGGVLRPLDKAKQHDHMVRQLEVEARTEKLREAGARRVKLHEAEVRRAKLREAEERMEKLHAEE